MFRIPHFYQDNDLTFDEAVVTMTSHGRGDLLEGMQAMNRRWEEHCAAQRVDLDNNPDDDFYSNYCYEVNAYNVVFENMSKLFH
jgi:hypothetical protein